MLKLIGKEDQLRYTIKLEDFHHTQGQELQSLILNTKQKKIL